MWAKALDEIQRAIDSLPPALAEHRARASEAAGRLFNQAAEPGSHGIFVSTGDIPAMWLRDSSFQVKPLLRFATRPAVYDFIAGVIRQQAAYIAIDPYANAFNIEANGNCWHRDFADQSPWVFERKFEIDSLASFLDISLRLAEASGSTEHLDSAWWQAAEAAVALFETELHHDPGSYVFMRKNAPKHDYLYPDGRGAEFAECGLIWSAFRPSDDACELPFNIPQNAYAAAQLERLARIAKPGVAGSELAARCETLAASIRGAIEKLAIVDGHYLYEIDGLGEKLFIDDANIPSLLSLPYLGYCSPNDSRYLATRAAVLSKKNKWYFEGSRVSHIGSPHTGANRVWPLAMAMEIITSENLEIEKLDALPELAEDGKGFHESISVDDPADFTREWFSWAEMTYFDAVFTTAEKLLNL